LKLSVIIPVRNGGGDLRVCLIAIQHGQRRPDEIIVVDDASTDDTVRTAKKFGARVISLGSPSIGPAMARNRGATEANGEIILFIDADVRVHADTLAKIEQYFVANPNLSALFGSYDDQPTHRGLVSMYKNLQHHYVHQNARLEASTFWSGCGAIRRTVFLEMGGFNQLYRRPSIEDIELGARLRKAGRQIWLCKDVQATHLKHWTLKTWLRTDIFDRAVPWSRLIFSSANIPSDLNLGNKSRLSAVAAWVLLACLVCGLIYPPAASAALFTGLGCVLALLGLNADLYMFFYRKGGARFTIGSFILHAVYYLYSSATFVMIYFEHLINKTGAFASQKAQ
jgi:glycosyltransferase involved in cell wall biosynthesis